MPPRSADDPTPAPEPLQVISLGEATAYPLHSSSEPRKMHFGILRNDGALQQSTVEDRRHGTHTFIPPDPSRFSAVESFPHTAIYAGAFHDVYGHFMLESLQRLWWAADHPDLPIVWMAPANATRPVLNAWQRDMLEILGIHNEVLILTRPARFDLLHVPDAGYKYADWSHPQQIGFLAAYQGPPQEDGSKVWLSRESETGVGVINRHIIERKLRDRGWAIATFEKMTLRDQLDTLSRAEVIAGEEGSTFHTLLLLRDIQGKKFRVFRRHGPEHISFGTIGDAREVDQTFHSCSHDAVISVQGRAVVRLAPNPAQYLSHLGVRIPPVKPLPEDRRPGHTVRRLNLLANIIGAQTYLQVGWRNRVVFTQVAVAARDIVDEEFRFDVRSYRGQGAEFYEVSLERFLTWFADGRSYDLVMIDNQHDWREALDLVRQVFASAAHERTVAVLDNTAPVEKGRGDVFKAVFALHDLHPELTYRTITTHGVPQTVIWRQRRVSEPRFGGLDAIEGLSFLDLEAHRGLLAPVTENQALDDVTARHRHTLSTWPSTGG